MLEEKQKYDKRGIVSIVLGAISFVPVVGFATGIIAIIFGIKYTRKNKSKLGVIGLILGSLGILLSIGIYGSLFYSDFIQRGGKAGLYSEMVSKQILPDAAYTIEVYKVRFGKYPDSIKDIEEISIYSMIEDPIQPYNNSYKTDKDKDVYFYYQNNGETYYIFSKGIDGQPFTEDDIYPIFRGDLGNMGYRKP